MYKKRWFFAFTLPAIFIFGVVIFLPTLLGIILSFTDWQLGNQMFKDGWVGFANYKTAFNDGTFTASIGYTSLFTLVTVIVVNIIGFGLATLLVKSFKGKNFFRGVFFVPNLIGGLVLGYLWKQIFDMAFTALFKTESMRVASRTSAMFAMAIVVAWQMAGYVMLIYIAALQNIDQSLKEASQIEGASKWKQFTSVILPGVMPAITVALFLVLSNSFKMFDQNLSLTEGDKGTDLLSLNIYFSAYNTSFRHTFGIAQSKAVIFTLLVSALALSQVTITKKMEVNA